MTTYVGLAEVAEILGVSRQRASQIVAGKDFPPPVERLRMGPLWSRAAVMLWHQRKEGSK